MFSQIVKYKNFSIQLHSTRSICSLRHQPRTSLYIYILPVVPCAKTVHPASLHFGTVLREWSPTGEGLFLQRSAQNTRVFCPHFASFQHCWCTNTLFLPPTLRDKTFSMHRDKTFCMHAEECGLKNELYIKIKLWPARLFEAHNKLQCTYCLNIQSSAIHSQQHSLMRYRYHPTNSITKSARTWKMKQHSKASWPLWKPCTATTTRIRLLASHTTPKNVSSVTRLKTVCTCYTIVKAATSFCGLDHHPTRILLIYSHIKVYTWKYTLPTSITTMCQYAPTARQLTILMVRIISVRP